MNFTFERFIGIDYSGAATPKSSLKGLRVYEADRLTASQEVMPPPSPRKYWTRRGIAEWLVERLSEGSLTLVGIDHGFSFPMKYFEQHGLPLDWPSFLDDFQRHWPTDENIYVDFVRDGSSGNGNPPRQLTLATASRALRRYRRRLGVRTHDRLARQLPTLGSTLRPFAQDLWRVFSYRLFHDRLTEGYAIASSNFQCEYAGCRN
jgi:hypothetical protein